MNNHLQQKLNKDLFELFARLINERTGLIFGDNNRHQLEQGIFNRTNRVGLEDGEQYLKYLRSHPERKKEFNNLLSEITINETFFFRIQPHFTAFNEYALPEIIREKKDPGEKIRIWSAGCSSGEEPYSIAISIKELLKNAEHRAIEIVGTDIDKKILKRAKQGVYNKRSLKDVDDSIKRKYFTRYKNGYRLNEDIRKMVDFRDINLLKPDKTKLQAHQSKFDLIFCRNVLIYFEIENQRRALNLFHECLSDKGFLFLGHSEILQYIDNRFVKDQYKQAFFYRKMLSEKRGQEKKDIEAPALKKFSGKGMRTYPLPEKSAGFDGNAKEQGMTRGDIEKNPEEYLEAAHEYFIKEKFQGAKDELKRYFRHGPKNAEALFLAAKTHMELGEKEKAVAQLLSTLNKDPLLGEARFLLGIIYQNMGKKDEALAELGKTIYIDDKFAPAYFYRGRIFEAEADIKKAVRDYKVTIELLKNNFKDESIGLVKGVTNGMLIESCDRNIRALEAKNG